MVGAKRLNRILDVSNNVLITADLFLPFFLQIAICPTIRGDWPTWLVLHLLFKSFSFNWAPNQPSWASTVSLSTISLFRFT